MKTKAVRMFSTVSDRREEKPNRYWERKIKSRQSRLIEEFILSDR